MKTSPVKYENVNINDNSTSSNEISSNTTSNPNNTEEVIIVQHSTDIFLLSSFCLLTMCNQAIWIGMSSIKDDVELYFNLQDPLLVDLFSNIYMFVFLILFLPATFFLNKYGLKQGILASAAFNATGAFLRYLFATGKLFGFCIFSQALCATSQVLNFCLIGELARTVVQPKLKGRAIGLIWFSTYFGVALGLWIPPMVVDDANDDLLPCLLSFGIIAILIFGLVALSLHLRRKNRTQQEQEQEQAEQTEQEAPSSNTGSTREFGLQLIALFQNKKYAMVTLGFGCAMGCQYAIATDIESLFGEVLGKDTDIGVLGLFFSVSAALGVLLTGVLLSSKLEWRETNTVSLVLSTVAAIALLGNVIGVQTDSVGFIFICTIVYGFAVTGLNASCLELGAAVSNGSQFAINGTMMCCVQLFGILWTMITSAIAAPDDQRKGDTSATVGALVFLMFAQLLATGLIYSSTKIEGMKINRRRGSSTNRLVSLISKEELTKESKSSGSVEMDEDFEI